MRRNLAAIVMLDMFLLLFFAISYFSIQSKPTLVVERAGNVFDSEKGIFIVFKSTDRGARKAFIDRRWIDVDETNERWIDEAVSVSCDRFLDSVCADEKYRRSEEGRYSISVGGPAGERAARATYRCLAGGYCGRLEIRFRNSTAICRLSGIETKC